MTCYHRNRCTCCYSYLCEALLRCVGRDGRNWRRTQSVNNIVERDELAATVKQVVEREGFCWLFTISRGLTLYIKLLQPMIMQAVPNTVVQRLPQLSKHSCTCHAIAAVNL